MADEITNEIETNVAIDGGANITTDGSLNTEEPKETPAAESKHIPYDRFKEKVDEANALKEKLAEYEKAQAEKERKELEEQNEYKTLYEQALEQAERAKQEALETKKSVLLTQAGYSTEQVEVLRGTISGETDEDLAEAIDNLKNVISPKKNYIDPTPMGGGERPTPKVNEGLGRSLYERVMGKK